MAARREQAAHSHRCVQDACCCVHPGPGPGAGPGRLGRGLHRPVRSAASPNPLRACLRPLDAPLVPLAGTPQTSMRAAGQSRNRRHSVSSRSHHCALQRCSEPWGRQEPACLRAADPAPCSAPVAGSSQEGIKCVPAKGQQGAGALSGLPCACMLLPWHGNSHPPLDALQVPGEAEHRELRLKPAP